LLSLFVLAHFGHHLIPGLLAPLLPYIRDHLSLTYTQAGWLVSANSLAYGLSQLPAGWLADRIGPRIVLTIGVAGVGLAGLLIGFAPSYLILVGLLVVLGVAGGGYHPASVPLVFDSVEAENIGKGLGLHQVGGSISFFVAPLIVAGLAGTLGWNGTFLTVSVPVIAFGIVFYLLLGRFGYGKKAHQTTDAGQTGLAPKTRRPLIVVLVLGIAIMGLIYSTTSFIPLFIVDHFGGVSNEAAAAMLSFFYVGGLFAGPLGGYLSDRLGSMPVLVTAGFIAGLALYLQNVVPLGVAFSAVLILLGTAMHLSMPAVESYIMSHTPKHKRSTILGIYYLGSRGGPAIAPAIGYLIDRYGFYTGFSVVSLALAAVTLICTVLLRRNLRPTYSS
jgi:MFS family permease